MEKKSRYCVEETKHRGHERQWELVIENNSLLRLTHTDHVYVNKLQRANQYLTSAGPFAANLYLNPMDFKIYLCLTPYFAQDFYKTQMQIST